MVDNTMLLVVHVVGDTGKYKLKINENGNSDVWKKFPLVYQLENGDEKKWNSILCLLHVLQNVPIQRQLWSPVWCKESAGAREALCGRCQALTAPLATMHI